MGVRRAVDMALDIAQRKDNKKIYTYGPLIHNPQAVEILEKRGIIPVNDIGEIKEGVIVIRAHGISPLERQKIREKNLEIIDATCPKVARVQAIIKKHASLGYTILIVGDRQHPEVDGLLGYAAGKGIVIGSMEEVDALPDLDKICVVAQTTQNAKDYIDACGMITKRFPKTTIFNTICDSTEKRQAEVEELSSEMDIIFIVGGKNSANTKRLSRISELQGTPTFHIETVDELEKIPVDRYKKAGVSAGASTPNWVIERVVSYLRNRKEAWIRRPLNLWIFAVTTDIYSAMGAGCLSLASMLLQGLNINLFSIMTASFYVYSMHTLNRFIDRRRIDITSSFRKDSYLKHKKMYVGIAIITLLLALTFSLITGPVPFFILLMISLAGVLYNTRLLPQNWRFKRLKDIAGSKTVSMAAAWGIVTSVVPQAGAGLSITAGTISAFLFTFSVVFARSAMHDIIDIQSDRFIGRETIPVLIGEENTMKLLKAILLFMMAVLAIVHPAGWTSSLSFALLPCVFYAWICFRFCDRKVKFSLVAVREGLLETNYIIAGLCASLWFILV